MHPILLELKLGSWLIPIHTYGLMIALGFLAGVYTVRKLAARSGVKPDLVSDLAFWLLMSGFVGARVLYIITRLDFFAAHPAEILRVWEGGLVFFGGLIAATGFAFWYFRKYRLEPWKMIDILSPGLVVAHAFGRLGCLAAGCCYGKPTGVPWGIRLDSELVDLQLRGIPLHPTQIYESTALFLLFVGMLWVFRHRKFEGQVGLTYFMIYPIIRSIIEVFRGDSVRGFVIDGILSTSQFISLIVFLAAAYWLSQRLKQAQELHHARRR